MQELEYQLSKEDYLDWIHWNVARQNLKKMKLITALIYGVFLVIYLGGSIAAKKDPASLISTVLMVVVLGVFMFYIISAKHQENVIWKRSGLKKLEKTVGFPCVRLYVREDGVTMEVPDQGSQNYSFTSINELEETERLFLLGVENKTWQFVAKSAFTDQSQMDKFKTYMLEKIADAKENPDKYKKEEPSAVHSSGESSKKIGQSDVAMGEDEAEEAEEEIEPVDTSNMGKIGKMAHIMAAMAAEQEEESESAAEGNSDNDMDSESGAEAEN